MLHHQPLDDDIVATSLHNNTTLGILITKHGFHVPIARWWVTGAAWMVVVVVRVVVACVRADLVRRLVHLRLLLLLGLMHHHHVAVQSPEIVHHRRSCSWVMMVSLHACHETVLLLLDVLLLKPSIAGGSIGRVVEACVALQARSSVACSQAVAQSQHAIEGTNIPLGTVAQLGIGCSHVHHIRIILVLDSTAHLGVCCCHVHHIRILLVLVVIGSTASITFLAIGIVVVIVGLAIVPVLVLVVIAVEPKLAPLVPQEAKLLLVVIVKLIVIVIIQIILF
jgi:hypothetical protein